MVRTEQTHYCEVCGAPHKTYADADTCEQQGRTPKESWLVRGTVIESSVKGEKLVFIVTYNTLEEPPTIIAREHDDIYCAVGFVGTSKTRKTALLGDFALIVPRTGKASELEIANSGKRLPVTYRIINGNEIGLLCANIPDFREAYQKATT